MTSAPMGGPFGDLIAEIRHNYARGRVMIAVDGANTTAAGGFADSLAAAGRGAGVSVFRLSIEGDTATEVAKSDTRTWASVRQVVAEFARGHFDDRQSDSSVPLDAMLIVDGRFLLRPNLRGVWHYRVWLEGDLGLQSTLASEYRGYLNDADPRGSASAIFNVSDADMPRRVWADSC